MDAVELLNSDEAEVPRVERDGSFAVRLASAWTGYLSAAASITASDFASRSIVDALPRMRELAEKLRLVHRAVLDGRADIAHAEMKQALDIVRPELNILRSNPLDADALGYLFRLRDASPSESIDRGGMFHVPFHLRHMVAPKRYSLTGLPMLYLGSTLLVCWEELNRLPFDRLWVAAFRLRAGVSVRVLDFGYRSALLAALPAERHSVEGAATRLVVAHAVLWPLIAACSFPKRFPEATFPEEYVIPQQVIAHLVGTGDFDGVRYFSNRVHTYGGDVVNLNFVFPAQPGVDDGYCPELAARFELTPPMPVTMVKLLGPPVNQGTPFVRSRKGIVELYRGHKVAYQHTEFAQIESHLLVQEFDKVC